MTPLAMPRIPAATYRIQLNHTFTFQDATQLIPYLNDLGITDLYSSPYFKAVPGSLHGYDVVDPTTLNPEIGSEDDYRAMIEELHRRGMGHLLDVVPNHMGITQQLNEWWRDVLENGPSSRYAPFFDIDWNPLKSELREKVLLPILGDQYGAVLERQELQLVCEDGKFLIRYFEHCLPLAPKSSSWILSHRLPTLIEELGGDSLHVMELQSIITALKHLPSRHELAPELVAERYREKEIIRHRLATLVAGSTAIRTFLQDNVGLINGVKGEPHSFDILDGILNDQAYRLAYWRVAAEEINYRRFFDINELAAIRMEDPTVFDETHRFLFRLVKDGAVTGLRIDHVDGLYDPADYTEKLRHWASQELPVDPQSAALPLYVVVEKILGVGEELPRNWRVCGTTGYDFLVSLNGLFVSRANERAFDALYAQFIGKHESFEELIYQCKRLIMQAAMASELSVLGHQLDRLSERDRRSRDFTINSLTYAIEEIVACFPVYRTYITGSEDGVPAKDRSFIGQAVTKAKRRNPAMSGLVFDFVRDLLLKEPDQAESIQEREERLSFVTKFQQTTSPVAAKGIEDTAFYRYHRFVSLNEVGSDPQQFGITPSLLHDQMKVRQQYWPASLSATSTHDTKRGEDVRARLNVLSEIPKQWKGHVTAWHKMNRSCKTKAAGELLPGPNEEYLLYQTLIGAWPFEKMDEEGYGVFVERIQGYMNKAVKEAKEHTSWVSRDEEYEDLVRQFIARVLDRSRANVFWDDFLPFQDWVAQYGIYNSLSQLLIKMTAPGVPDFYQGTELWDLNLVDPDNRRPIDFPRRISLLAELDKASTTEPDRMALVQELVKERVDGRIKLFLTAEMLRYRRAHPLLFQHGDYVKLEGMGTKSEHVFAFARLHTEGSIVSVVPRLLTGMTQDPHELPLGDEAWNDTELVLPAWREGTIFRNIFTGEILSSVTRGERQVLPMGKIFMHCPVACLEKTT